MMKRRRSLLLAALGGGLWPFGRLQAAGVRGLNHGMRLRPERGTDGFEFVFHEPSQQWVGQECQIRVDAARALPVPLAAPRQQATMAVQLFGGLTIERANITGGVENMQTAGEWHWWWIDKPMGELELKRPQRLGVQLSWPDAAAPNDAQARRTEPMELFSMPAIDALPPGQWTPWQAAVSRVSGSDAPMAVAHGRAAPSADVPSGVPSPAWPFELRCRAALWPTPYRRQRS